MSLIVLNPDGLEKEINEFEKSKNKIRQIFDREKKTTLILNNGHSWVGKAGNAMYNKQQEFQKNFDPIIEALDVFIKYMKTSLEEYRKAEKETMIGLEKNSESLDVNS